MDLTTTKFEITEEELAVLHHARFVLKALAKRAGEVGYNVSRIPALERDFTVPNATSFGRMQERCDETEYSIFQVMSCADSFLNFKIGDEIMYNRTPEEQAVAVLGGEADLA